MFTLLYTLCGLAVVSAVLGYAVYHYWMQLFEGDHPEAAIRGFMAWTFKGWVCPLAILVVLNLGILVPPLFPHVDLARAAGVSSANIVGALVMGCFLIVGTYWAAVTFLWIVGAHWHQVSDRSDFLGLAGFWSAILLPVSAVIFWAGGTAMAGVALLVWMLPLAHTTLTIPVRRPPRPMYSRAIAKLKMGKYADAEIEVVKQLERSEQDFDGWMMLAQLYAERFKEMDQAEKAICDLCDQPNLTGMQISLALQQLATWQLKIGRDPQSARWALEQIVRKLPNTHFARMAEQRMAQVPGSLKELIEQEEIKPVRLPALSEDILERSGAGSTLSRPDAVALANRLVEKLTANPNDVAARERLAITLADPLRNVEQGIEQLELLVGMPGQPDSKRAEWLGLIAAWHLQFRNDIETARTVLARIVHEYPQTAQAFAAQRRLNLMEFDDRMDRSRSRT